MGVIGTGAVDILPIHAGVPICIDRLGPVWNSPKGHLEGQRAGVVALVLLLPMRVSLQRVMLCVVLKGNVSFVVVAVVVVVVVDDDGQRFRIYTYTYNTYIYDIRQPLRLRANRAMP